MRLAMFSLRHGVYMDDARADSGRCEARIEHRMDVRRLHEKTPADDESNAPDYPALIGFPQEVMREFPNGYFNSTAAYAVALRHTQGRDKNPCSAWISHTWALTTPRKVGRALNFCLEMAAERGIKLSVPQTTSLLDACNAQALRFYGFDTMDLHFTRDDTGLVIEMTERTP